MTKPASRLTIIALIALLHCCASSTEVPRAAGMGSSLGSSTDASGAVTEKFDLSGDRVADLWKVYRLGKKDKAGKPARRLVQKHMDLNWDGKVDVRQHFDATDNIFREEMDLDFDGVIDAVAFYTQGKLVKRQQDLTFDGRPDVFKFYQDGDLVRKERDSNNDGKVDTWEYFENGRIIRMGMDRDGDGKPEIFEDAPEKPVLPDANEKDPEKGEA